MKRRNMPRCFLFFYELYRENVGTYQGKPVDGRYQLQITCHYNPPEGDGWNEPRWPAHYDVTAKVVAIVCDELENADADRTQFELQGITPPGELLELNEDENKDILEKAVEVDEANQGGI